MTQEFFHSTLLAVEYGSELKPGAWCFPKIQKKNRKSNERLAFLRCSLFTKESSIASSIYANHVGKRRRILLVTWSLKLMKCFPFQRPFFSTLMIIALRWIMQEKHEDMTSRQPTKLIRTAEGNEIVREYSWLSSLVFVCIYESLLCIVFCSQLGRKYYGV